MLWSLFPITSVKTSNINTCIFNQKHFSSVAPFSTHLRQQSFVQWKINQRIDENAALALRFLGVILKQRQKAEQKLLKAE
jgi:hypothetical protein